MTCANSFHHYPHQDLAVREMRRVLRPGGRLILVDGYRVGAHAIEAKAASYARRWEAEIKQYEAGSNISLQTAKINTGFELQVPLFCNIGDKIEIDTRTDEYRSRA